MNLIMIDSEQMPYHTDVRLIFDALEGRQKEFNWLITGHECVSWTSIIEALDEEVVFLSGEKFTDIVNENGIQFIWGILSAFDKSVDIDVKNLAVLPNFDGKWKYGGGDVQTQHPLAVAEIVCVDSSYTIFLSKDDDLSRRFMKHYSDAQDLHKWNKEISNQIQIIRDIFLEELASSNKILPEQELMNMVRGIRYEVLNNTKNSTEDSSFSATARKIVLDKVMKLQ